MKDEWTDADFKEMGWHDSYIHMISFPKENFEMIFDIDYIFEWVLDEQSGLYKFWISPCKLIFFDIFNLKINLDFENSIGVSIENINRTVSKKSSNEKVTIWNYEIITDKGIISFESTGYKQFLNKQPILSLNQVLERNQF